MFCPQCGIREDQPKQFCRACGSDLRIVRAALAKPEPPTGPQSARDEIGRVLALKINELHSASDLKKVAEDVLPEIEKFLESPEEKRLRRFRTGVTLAVIGLGAIILGPLLSELLHERDMRLLGALGVIPFLLGLGTLLNGLLFSLPKNRTQPYLPEPGVPSIMHPATSKSAVTTNELPGADKSPHPSSITEHTTHQLPNVLRQ